MENQNTPTQELKRLYAVQKRWYTVGTISEYAVVKETEKTYVVTEASNIGKPNFGSRFNTNTVKKSDMEIYDKHYCESYAAALAYKKQLLENYIASNERRIADMTAENEKNRAAIAETEAEIQKLNGGN